jgi:hypothetical protein
VISDSLSSLEYYYSTYYNTEFLLNINLFYKYGLIVAVCSNLIQDARDQFHLLFRISGVFCHQILLLVFWWPVLLDDISIIMITNLAILELWNDFKVGPRGSKQISVLKMVPNLPDNHLQFKLYLFIIMNYFKERLIDGNNTESYPHSNESVLGE